MLTARLVVVLCLFVAACGAPARAAGVEAVVQVERPDWLQRAPHHLAAIRACTGAGQGDIYALDVRVMYDLRVGVLMLDGLGRVQRCVFRQGTVIYRENDKTGLSAGDFLGRPALSAGARRPALAPQAYVERLMHEGRTVAWVHWPGVETNEEAGE